MFEEKNIFLIILDNPKVLVKLFFITYLGVGLYIFRDYGIAFDEDIQRLMAQNRIDYIKFFFSDIFTQLNTKIKDVIIKWPEYGVAFELPALWFEKLFNFSNTRNEYFFRHLLVFLTSFVGSIFFFLLIKQKFKSWKIGLIGTFLLITSPRIFAESFYNSKDIIFMYFFIINVFFSLKFLEKPSLANSLIFAFTSSLCIGVRVIGLLIPFVTLFFLWIKYLRKDYYKSILPNLAIFFLSFLFFLILLWPSLWENSFENFFYSLKSFKSYDYEIFNYYFGHFVYSKAIHWFYFPLWISVTTPFFIILLFMYGFSVSIYRIFNRLIKISKDNDLNDLWRGRIEFQELFFTVFIIAPIFLVVVFKSTSYSGWRHLYFIYPFIILLSLSGLNILYRKIIKIKSQKIIYLSKVIFSLILINNLFWLYTNHPFQNNYFNFLAGKKPHNNFEVDYWGLSNKFVLEKIISNDTKEIIKVTKISDTSLSENFNILTESQKKRIKYVGDITKSDYIVNNNIFFNGDTTKVKKIPNNFNVYYQLFVDDTLVTTIYKRNNPL